MSQRHRIKIAPSRPKPFAGTSPLAVHSKLGVARNCDGCGSDFSVVKFTTFVLLTDLTPEQRIGLAMRSPEGKLATVDLKAGKAAMVGQQAACPACRPALEKAVARGPSYAFVDVLEAPREIMVGAVSVAGRA